MTGDDLVRGLRRRLAAGGPEPGLLRELREAADDIGVRQRRDPVWVYLSYDAPKRGRRAAVAGPFQSASFKAEDGSIIGPDLARGVADSLGNAWVKAGRKGPSYDVATVSAATPRPERRIAKLVAAVSSGKLQYLAQLERLSRRTEPQPRVWTRPLRSDEEAYAPPTDGPFIDVEARDCDSIRVMEQSRPRRRDFARRDDYGTPSRWFIEFGMSSEGETCDLIHVSTRPPDEEPETRAVKPVFGSHNQVGMSVRLMDLGFDVRLQGMAVDVPRGVRSVAYTTRRGEDRFARGSDEEIVRELRASGYRARLEPGP